MVFIAEEGFLSEGKYASSSFCFRLMFIILKSGSIAYRNTHKNSQKCCFLYHICLCLGLCFFCYIYPTFCFGVFLTPSANCYLRICSRMEEADVYFFDKKCDLCEEHLSLWC
jgi:hypothetical protein